MGEIRASRALQVACPFCGSRPQQPCVYTVPNGMTIDFDHCVKVSQRRLLARSGLPTRQPHKERIQLAHSLMSVDTRGSAESATARQRSRIAACESEWDRLEVLRLRSWLSMWAHILIHPQE